jgi:hypothetical protein
VSDDVSGKKHFFDDPKNVQRVLRTFFAACVVVLLLDVVNLVLGLVGGPELRHAERSWEGLPGFYSLYGFVACVVLVLIATQMRKVLMRDEDYYDR